MNKALILICCLLASPALAATYYLSPTGNDSAAGSISAPWVTPQKAANTMVAGDMTIMLNGTYVQAANTSINFNVNPGPVALIAQNKGQAIISTKSNCSPAINVFESNVTLSNFVIALDPGNVDCNHYTAQSVSIWGYGGTNNPNPCSPATNLSGLVVRGVDIDSSNARVSNTMAGVGARSLGVKTNQDNTSFDGLTIYGSVESLNSANTVMSNSIIYGGYSTSAEENINFKAGSRNGKAFNNIVHCNLPGEGGNLCMALGGHSSGYWWDSVQADGYITSGVMHITSIVTGCTDSVNGISIGSVVTQLEDVGVPNNVSVVSDGTGTGGTGTYNLSSAITLGSMGSPVVFTISHTNTEAYNIAAYDNVIIDESGGAGSAVGMVGCSNCTFSNNVVVGSQVALAIGSEGGFSPMPSNASPNFINNIWYGSGGSAQGGFGLLSNFTGTLTMDHSNWYAYTNVPTQTNAISGNPNFVNAASDWHLQAGSPDIGAGTPVTANAFGGGTIPVNVDFAGITRQVPWDAGIYAYASTPPPPPNMAAPSFLY